MNYFEYNANKYLPKGRSSHASYEVLDAPAEWRQPSGYDVEHGEVTREMWEKVPSFGGGLPIVSTAYAPDPWLRYRK